MKVRLTLLFLPLLLVVNFQTATAQAASSRTSCRAKAVAQQANNSISSNESSMILLLRYIHAAEATFQATTGAGHYGTLQELYLARFIDVKIRSGVNDGYRFVLSVSNPAGAPSTFEVIARPVSYMESGVRTFAIDQTGALQESYEQSPLPAQLQLVTDECGSVICTEANARSVLRTIHSAEATFQSTVGAGRYGTLQELAQNNLISESLAAGSLNGYSFRIRVDDGSKNEPASFEAIATPLRFPRTGVLSFYMDETGILRGGNKNGLEADPGDDPICG